MHACKCFVSFFSFFLSLYIYNIYIYVYIYLYTFCTYTCVYCIQIYKCRRERVSRSLEIETVRCETPSKHAVPTPQRNSTAPWKRVVSLSSFLARSYLTFFPPFSLSILSFFPFPVPRGTVRSESRGQKTGPRRFFFPRSRVSRIFRFHVPSSLTRVSRCTRPCTRDTSEREKKKKKTDTHAHTHRRRKKKKLYEKTYTVIAFELLPNGGEKELMARTGDAECIKGTVCIFERCN